MSKSTMKNKISPTSPPALSMSNFKSSQNYLWNTNAVLGKGATGAVYFGHNKHCGETVAVKCFNHLSHMRPYEVQKREFEVLKKVNHENIVKLLAIEEENDTKQKVLVMELCTGGSLFNILDDPLNSSGLEEKEFLLVLKHLAAGMKHLRDMNIIHRDLKPGNIMKFVTEDGTSIYKLTDFGAARELDDDQQFMSLYGTEEYLHPDMYERAVLRKPVGKSFKANVDLWSIGVTLYHIATGSLPFRPYGGRKNKETMYKITTEKASGIISGTQTSENGEIKWNCNLPESCLLSPSVQPLVTELLAGLLECDAHRMWSFEKFFSSVTNILEHRVVFVFYVGTLSLYSIYCHSSQKIIELKSKFESMFNIDSKDQILIWSNDELNQINSMASNINNILFSDVKLSSYNLISNSKRTATNSLNPNGLTIVPDDLLLTELGTTENVPLFLLNGQINSKIRSLTGPIILSKFPDIASSAANTDVDAQFAKLCSSLAYAMLRQIDRFVHNYKLACTIPAHMLKLINRNVKHLNKKQSSIHFHYNTFKERLEATLYMNNTINQLIKSMSDNDKILDSNLRGLQLPNIDHIKAQFDKIEYNLKSLTSSSIMDEKLEQLIDLWPSAKEFDNTRRLVAAQSKAKIYSAKIRESWLLLHKDKQIKSLNFHEEQLHQLEKMKLDNFCKKLNDLIVREINPCLTIADKLEEWYQGAQVAYVKPQLIISELTDFLPSIHQMEQELQIGKDDQLKVINCLLQQTNEFKCDSNDRLVNYVAMVKNLEQQLRSKQSQNAVSTSQSTSLNRNNNNSSLIDALSTLNGNIDPDTQLFREILSLRESTKALKDAFRDYELVFSEVESFTPGSG